MILFVFEGKEREPELYRTLEMLYFSRGNNNIICSFMNNIYELYKDMDDLGGDGDVVSVLREKLTQKGDHKLDGLKSSDFSEIYLFFDYDFQHAHLTLEEINERLEAMLAMFDEETGNGKLYINYPMVESIKYTKELPDEHFVQYVVSRDECLDFKEITHNFSFYKSLDHILFKDGESPSKERYLKVSDNWQYLKKMNVCKANFIVCGKNEMPFQKDDINQMAIFRCQKSKYVDTNETVAVLNSFPLFIYDYFK